jgi:hypothetical protein
MRSVSIATLMITALLLIGCSRAQQITNSPDLAAEIDRIKAIDNHAHPVRMVLSGPPDREFDALPVDNMEPSSDPLNLRPTAPTVVEAWRALFGYSQTDGAPDPGDGAGT